MPCRAPERTSHPPQSGRAALTLRAQARGEGRREGGSRDEKIPTLKQPSRTRCGRSIKVGLAAAKAAALRSNLNNIDGCIVVAPHTHTHTHTASARSLAPTLSRVRELPTPRHPHFTQYPFAPRPLVRGGKTSPHRLRLFVSHSKCPPLSPPPKRTAL